MVRPGGFAPLSDAERMAAMEFNAEDREMIAVLRGVVEKRGAAALANPALLLGLLRDHLPDRARAIGLLMTAHGRASVDFTQAPTLEAAALENQARALAGETGLREDVARWAVGIWAAALAPLASLRQPAPGPPGGGPAFALPAAAGDEAARFLQAVPEAALQVVAARSADARSPPAAAPAPGPARKSLWLGVGVAAALAVSLAIPFALLRDRPLALSGPVARTHGGRAATLVGSAADGSRVVLASVSPDPSDWPVMPDAGPPDGDARLWRFTTGIKFADGRVLYYRATVNPAAGQAEVRAGNLSPPGSKAVSVSPSSPVIPAPEVAGQLDVIIADWRDDGAEAPSLCLKLTLDTARQTFEPKHFCATRIAQGACAAEILGCGFFR